MLPPTTHPKLTSWASAPGTFQRLYYRTPGEKYGSTLTKGVGSGTLTPRAPCAVVVSSSSVCVPDVTLRLCAPPSCRFTATGSRLPPTSRNPAVPPYDIARTSKVFGSQDATPAVSVTVPSPNATRPPYAYPCPAFVL